MNPIARRLQILLVPALSWTAWAAAAPEPRVEAFPPRDFGYVLGDLVEQRFAIAVPEAYALETGALPAPGALDENLDLHGLSWDETHAQGEARYRLRIVYQTFKGVREAEKATVPPLTLRFHGPEPLEAHTPAWEFTVAPLIPPQLPDEKVAIRAALPPVPIAMADHEGRLAAYLAALLALLGYLGWRRYAPARRDRPFARAQRALRRLLRGPAGAGADGYRAAARRLHRALDETAGGTLFAEQLAGFCAERPAFAGLAGELAEFFALSQRLFFAEPETPPPADYPAARLESLCRRCAQAERSLHP